MKKVFYPGAVVIRKRYPEIPYRIKGRSSINASLGDTGWEAFQISDGSGPWHLNDKNEENYQLYEDYMVEQILTKYENPDPI